MEVPQSMVIDPANTAQANVQFEAAGDVGGHLGNPE